jgi:hypothetical protein
MAVDIGWEIGLSSNALDVSRRVQPSLVKSGKQ